MRTGKRFFRGRIIKFLILGGVLFSLLPFSCRRNRLDISKMEFEATPVISKSEMWGVVRERYLPVPAERGSDQNIVVTLRKGDITRILRSERIDDIIWCELEYTPPGGELLNGWVLEETLTVYDSFAKAQEGSKDQTEELKSR